MKRLMKKMLPIIGMVLILTTATYASELEVMEINSDYTLEEMLAYALQDEQMAQVEYENIMGTFGEVAPFVNIAQAEVSHEAAVLRLYDLYGFEVPQFDIEPNTDLPNTLAETYSIGVVAEQANIAMYEAFLKTDLDDTVRTVFESLQNASEYHLAAFMRGSENECDGECTEEGLAVRNGADNENGQKSGETLGFGGNNNDAGTGNGTEEGREQRGQGNKGLMTNRRTQLLDPDNSENPNN